MSADFPSSNPFRRKTPSNLPLSSAAPERPSAFSHVAYQQADPLPGSSSLNFQTKDVDADAPKKVAKKVRVQSPPPPSPSTPSIPDSSSTIGEESFSINAIPPTPPIRRDDDPFENVTSDTSEDEAPIALHRAPANPFSKTLETMEHPERDGGHIPSAVTSPGRASMDVEAFKRLLMTGNSGLATPPTQSATQAHVAHHALGDGGSSTDTSSLSRQSLFETIQEPHPESPRTSHEISEPEEDRTRLSESQPIPTGRKKPPPPSSRHGKLIKVELRDESITTALQSPPTPGSITSQHYFSSSPRSQTDLNKPLPPAPSRKSNDSDRESVFDKEAAGKTPEPPSPDAYVKKKTAPPIPLARRQSQRVSESRLNRSDSGRLSPKAEEDIPSLAGIENTRPRSDSGRLPPPPPSRRPGSVRGSSSHNTPLSSPSTVSLPPPPPARGSSRSTSGGKPPSVKSMDISNFSNTNTKRTSIMPPPPPPHRHGRSSFDATSPGTSARPSGEYRRSMDSARRGSAASSVVQEETVNEHVQPDAPQHDILADLSRLQREIDALRTQSVANEKVS